MEIEVFEIESENDYNYARQRARRVVTTSEVTTDERIFVYGPSGELLGEYDEQGLPLVEYIYLEGEPLAQIHDDSGAVETYFVHNSHLGTPEIMTDDSAAVVWSRQVTPFGEISGAPSGSVSQSTRFPGQYADADTQLSYNWHRYYDSSLGRYISTDVIGQAGGLNVYEYAAGNPTTFTDPTGQIIPAVAVAAAKAAAVGALLGGTLGALGEVLANIEEGCDLSDGVGEAFAVGALTGGVGAGTATAAAASSLPAAGAVIVGASSAGVTAAAAEAATGGTTATAAGAGVGAAFGGATPGGKLRDAIAGVVGGEFLSFAGELAFGAADGDFGKDCDCQDDD